MAATGKVVMKWGVLLLVQFLILYEYVNGKYTPLEVEIISEPNGEPAKIFTANEIKKYDGSHPSKRVFMAVKGVVFDVTEGKDFYGKGAPYSALAAKDASRAVALWSLDAKDLTHDLSGLDDETLKGLDDTYLETYKKKYPVVGYMDYLLDTHADKFKDRFKGEL